MELMRQIAREYYLHKELKEITAHLTLMCDNLKRLNTALDKSIDILKQSNTQEKPE